MAEKPIFGEEMIAAWTEALECEKPDPLTEADLPALPQVNAILPQSTNTSMVLSLTLKNGGTLRFEMNPVAARHLALCILVQGKDAGWLDENGNVISPTYQLDS